MTVTLQQALTARTKEQALADLLAELEAAGVDVLGFEPFTVERGLPELDAQAHAFEEDLRVQVVKGMVLEEAATLDDPAWLRRLAKGWYQIDWIRGTKAVHELKLTNTASAGPFVLEPRKVVATTADDIQFRNIEGGTLNAGAGQFLRLRFAAERIGTIGNVAAGQIAKLVTGLPGVIVTNESNSLIAAGVPDEPNQSLVARSKSRWGTLGAGGSSTAYRYLISQAAPTVTRVFVRDDNPMGPGTVALYLANPSGPATVDEVAAVDAKLQPLKPLGSGRLYVLAATARVVNVAGVLYTDGTNGVADAEATTRLQALATGFDQPVLYLERLRSTLMSVKSAINVVLSAPVGDTALLAHEVLQLTRSGLVVQ